ncbi:MAG TPA: nuclear transport factor 2 family protein [Chryseosolibacter sp.]
MIRLSCLLLVISISVRAQTEELHAFIDQWHLAATTANEKQFFDAIDDEAIYIGTDASERWTKAEFRAFAKPHFDKGKAWDFKAHDRDLHVSADGKYVWFSELLTTWMGICRGSGILYNTPTGWKIKQYHLAVTVPNETIKDFISLVEKYNQQKR